MTKIKIFVGKDSSVESKCNEFFNDPNRVIIHTSVIQLPGYSTINAITLVVTYEITNQP